MTESTASRLYYIDNMRVMLISLIVLIHLAITYGAPGDWYYQEVLTDDINILSLILYSLFNATVQAFALGLFFMISGYFTAASFDRKGARRFIKDRLKRLGIPLVCYVMILNPVLEFILHKFVYEGQQSFAGFMIQFFKNKRTVAAGPLWFVEALLLFSLVYVCWRFATKHTFDKSRFVWRVPGNGAIVLFAGIVGLMTFAVRLIFPVFWSWALLGFQFPHFSQYIMFFIAGI
jgi:fucose 4-O-acetylase-like acetyltransferase